MPTRSRRPRSTAPSRFGALGRSSRISPSRATRRVSTGAHRAWPLLPGPSCSSTRPLRHTLCDIAMSGCRRRRRRTALCPPSPSPPHPHTLTPTLTLSPLTSHLSPSPSPCTLTLTPTSHPHPHPHPHHHHHPHPYPHPHPHPGELLLDPSAEEETLLATTFTLLLDATGEVRAVSLVLLVLTHSLEFVARCHRRRTSSLNDSHQSITDGTGGLTCRSMPPARDELSYTHLYLLLDDTG